MIRRRLPTLWHKLIAVLRNEAIVALQTMYYVMIIIAGVYLALAANAPPQNVEPVMGHPQYEAWLGLNILCPAMTLIGRRLGRVAANVAPGSPNPAKGAAWLQLFGDIGVWGAVTIYVLCVIETTDWGAGLYGAFFAFMGVPGGALFTLLSTWRLMQISHGERAS